MPLPTYYLIKNMPIALEEDVNQCEEGQKRHKYPIETLKKVKGILDEAAKTGGAGGESKSQGKRMSLSSVTYDIGGLFRWGTRYRRHGN